MKKIIGLLLLTGMAVFIAACSSAEDASRSSVEVNNEDKNSVGNTKDTDSEDTNSDDNDSRNSSSKGNNESSSKKPTNGTGSQTQDKASSNSEFAYFQTPTKNIWCNSPSANSTACVITNFEFETEYLAPAGETRDCELDWEGIFLITNDSASSGCVSDTSYSTTRDGKTLRLEISESDIPVLEYGATNIYDNVTCVSEKSGLSCANANGQGIVLSKESGVINP